MTTRIDMNWGYFLGLSGVLGLDRHQVTEMTESRPDADGDVLVTWWALEDQGSPCLGEELGAHVRLDETPPQWTGQIRLTGAEINGLRPKLSTFPEQEDADYFGAGEPDEDDPL
jgi:hypothetical protein